MSFDLLNNTDSIDFGHLEINQHHLNWLNAVFNFRVRHFLVYELYTFSDCLQAIYTKGTLVHQVQFS